jgi:serine/threonine-protein kinase RsbT
MDPASMQVDRKEEKPLRSQDDVVLARQAVRRWAQELGLGLVDQTKVVTASSELARNALVHGGGGSIRLELIRSADRRGLRLTFVDAGPGIPDLSTALRDGFTTGAGLGLGLGGSRRLVDDFELDSSPGTGTRVTVVKWA